MRIVGGIFIVFAIADFGLSYMGINLTPFFPPKIAQFSPIIIGAIGFGILKLGEKGNGEKK